jgi:hypothetical protein
LSQRDLQLKLTIRKILWHAGYSNRLNVVLSTLIAGERGSRAGVEGFTDIDVLGVLVTPDFRVVRSIADCSTSARNVAQRLFWLSGVMGSFDADAAYMLRSQEVPPSARQLAERLRIAILTPPDTASLGNSLLGSEAERSEFAPLFDAAVASRLEREIDTLPGNTSALRTYRRSLFWTLPLGQNLMQMVSQLGRAKEGLDPSNRVSLALFIDCTWLYAYVLADTCSAITRLHLSDIEGSLKRHMFGGDIGIRARETLLTRLNALRKELERRDATPEQAGMFGLTPPYFTGLLELIARMLRRPHAASRILRLAEYTLYAVLMGGQGPARQSFAEFDEIASKLFVDIAAFLAEAADLPMQFVEATQALISGEMSQPQDKPATVVQPTLLNP